MLSADYFRAEAERCRELATKASDSESMRRWIRLAIEYEQLADSHMPSAEVIRFPLGEAGRR